MDERQSPTKVQFGAWSMTARPAAQRASDGRAVTVPARLALVPVARASMARARAPATGTTT